MVECRVLLSTPTIAEYPIPGSEQPSNRGLTVASDGNFWFVGADDDIGILNATTHAFTDISVGALAIDDSITSGPLGDIWFSQYFSSQIVQVNPTTDSIVSVYPTADRPDQLISLPNGNIWFTDAGDPSENIDSGLGELNTATGEVSIYNLPTGELATSLTAAADGNIWYGDELTNSIGLFNTTTHQTQEFPIQPGSPLADPTEMTVGPDGNVWFVEYATKMIGELNTQTDQIQNFALPSGSGYPFGIVGAADGDLWFTVAQPGLVGSINPTTDLISTYALPDPDAFPTSIVATPDGNLWIAAGDDYLDELTPPPVVGTQLVVRDEPTSSVDVGAAIGLTVDVDDSSDEIDTSFNGTVTVALGHNAGGATLGGTLTATAVNGVATFSGLTLSAAGNGYTLILSANGIAPEPAVLAPATTSAIDVLPNATTTMVSVSPGGVIVGEPVTVTATVAVAASDILSPTGVVTFTAGATVIGTEALSTTGGMTTASLTFSPIASGVLSLTAAYGGDSGDVASSAVSSVTVGQDSTTTSVSTLSTSSVYGQSVTLTATIGVMSPGAGTPTGLVTFLDGTATLGTGTVSTVAGVSTATFTTTDLSAGTHSITAEYGGDPNDTPSASATIQVGVTPATAMLTLGSLSFTYDGTAQGTTVTTSPAGLSGVTIAYSLNGTSVAAPVSAGSYTVMASLVNSNYTASPLTGTLVIGQATPVITWNTPASLIFGTAITATQLDATASITVAGTSINIPGQFVYNDPIGTILAAGNAQPLTVSFTPTDTVDFTDAEGSTTITVEKAAPVLTWGAPAGIVYGTSLEPGQLDATASVPGTFTYQQTPGTVLNAGAGQTLTATFTPSDLVDYLSGTVTTTIDVSPAPLTITAQNASGTAGEPLPAFSVSYQGFVDGQGPDVLGGSLSLSTSASSSSPAGTYAIVPGGLVSSNYAITYANGTLILAPGAALVVAPVTTAQAAPPAVEVTAVRWEKVKITRKKSVEELVITLSGSLNAADAVNLGAYSLDLGKKVKRVGTVYTKPVPLTSVSYNAQADEVMLTLRGALPSGKTQLTINTSLIRDSYGRPLAGSSGGQSGGNFVTLVNRSGEID
jgi:streptogramin lyase